MRRKKIDNNWFVSIFLVFVLLVGVSACYQYGTQKEVEFTVSDKTVKVSKESSKYLIFTSSGVYENTDSLFHMKFNSSDLYSKLKKKEKYKCKTYGFRIPFLSMYPNLINCK